MRAKKTRVCPQCGVTFELSSTYPQQILCSRKCWYDCRARPAEERFWEKVTKSTKPDGCWLWTVKPKSKKSPYAAIKIRGKGSQMVHRFSYELHYGPIPDGLCVCHRCDTPLCIRPDHLFLGTLADNNSDMASKGRAARGEGHGWSKLTDAQVVEIRALRKSGLLYREIGERFGITPENVGYIIRRVRWKHV